MPPKVVAIPYFPMVAETNARQGFLTDEQYVKLRKLRDALPDYLKPLFISAYSAGVRVGELQAIKWRQVDWDQGFITLDSEHTKNGYARAIPILDGDMKNWLTSSKNNADGGDRVLQNELVPIKDFRGAWKKACDLGGIPGLKFHDLRRTWG
jgi:integrase